MTPITVAVKLSTIFQIAPSASENRAGCSSELLYNDNSTSYTALQQNHYSVKYGFKQQNTTEAVQSNSMC